MARSLICESRLTAKLRPHPHNSRFHSTDQIIAIWSSIEQFGFTNPLLIDETDTILAGHGRWLAAKYGEMQEVPCIVINGLTEAQKRLYVVADNRLSEQSSWDKDTLAAEVAFLNASDFDLSMLDFESLHLEIAALSQLPTDGLPPSGDAEVTTSDFVDKAPAAQRQSSPEHKVSIKLSTNQYSLWLTLRNDLSDQQLVARLLDQYEAVAEILNAEQ